MNKLFLTSTLTIALLASTAHAGSVDWGSRSKSMSYGLIAVGATAFAGAWVSNKIPSPNTEAALSYATVEGATMIAGAGLAVAGGTVFIGDIASDTLSDDSKAKEMAAQHRFVVRQAEALAAGRAVGLDQNLSLLLSSFECKNSCDDQAKRSLLAQAIISSDRIGRGFNPDQMINGQADAQASVQIVSALGENATDANINLLKFIAAQGYVAVQVSMAN